MAPRRSAVDPQFPARLRELRAERGLSLRDLAQRAFSSKSQVHGFETGASSPTPETVRHLDQALDARGELLALIVVPIPRPAEANDEMLAALELSHRVAASDVGAGTLDQLESAVDDLAIAYARVPPLQVLPNVRRHLDYVAQLLDARKTLNQQRRLLIAGGWVALISATVHIDLMQRETARAELATARQMAEHADHEELQAWVLETRAWDALTSEGNFSRAVALSQQAQALAPHGSSAHIQATAQEGRALARMGRRPETLDALNRTTRLVSNLTVPDEPEHHYRYDPGKALAYMATTLSWVGDPAAAAYAQGVVNQMENGGSGSDAVVAARRPRRAAAARLDLSLALLGAGKPDEASAAAMVAINSGLLVPSNWWRATEIVTGVGRAGIPEAAELRDAYHAFAPARK